MNTTINVIVTCTKQKTCEAPSNLQLRNVSAATVQSRVGQWKCRIDRSATRLLTPKSLYAGDHWAVAKSIAAMAKSSVQIQVWVISAGYGLLSLDTQISPYSATFSTRHPDTVVTPVDPSRTNPQADKRAWWNALISLDWDREKPISISDLAAEYSNCPLLIAASTNYLHAVQDDLTNAWTLMKNKDHLAIISAGTSAFGDLTENLVPCDSRLQPLVGGVLRSLNVRLLRYALDSSQRIPPSLTTISKRFEKLLHEAPERPKYSRAHLSDDDIRRFVRQAIQRNEGVTQSNLLRQLRDSGKACEQGRFRTLFKEVQGSGNG